MFAALVPVLITGTWAERMTVKSFFFFVTLWPILVYYPLAHWIWNPNGWLAQLGVLDFAGGITVHTTAGIAALAVSIVLSGRLRVLGHHNLPLAMLGGIIIWAGWYFFNAGSAFHADSTAVTALVNTHIGACVGSFIWGIVAYLIHKKWGMLLTSCQARSSVSLALPPAQVLFPLKTLLFWPVSRLSGQDLIVTRLNLV